MRLLVRTLSVRCKTFTWSDATLLDMAKVLIPDQPWEIFEPLLPSEEPDPGGVQGFTARLRELPLWC